MKNLKHTIMAVTAVTMVGTLSFFQVSGKTDITANLVTDNKSESITIEENLNDAEKQAIAEKSTLTTGYAKVTGSTEIKVTPSDDAQTVGTMSGAEDVEVLETTEGWYKVAVDGQTGYVKDGFITLDHKEAETAAKQYDNYKKAKVTAEKGLIVRSSGSKESSSIGTLLDGEEIIIVDAQNDYIKILFGDELTEGYVINTGLVFEDQWITKNEVHTEIKEIEYINTMIRPME